MLFQKLKINKRILPTKFYIFSLFSLLFSLVLVLQSKISFDGNVYAPWSDQILDTFYLRDVIFFILVFVLVLFACLLAEHYIPKLAAKVQNSSGSITQSGWWKNFIISSLLMFFESVFFLAINYPGSVVEDSVSSLDQALDRQPYSNHHPLAFTLFVKIFVQIGARLKSVNFGVALFSLAQSFLIACTIGYFIAWLYKHKINLYIRAAVLLFFLIDLIFASYAIVMWKDPLFSIFVFLLTLLLFDLAQSDGLLLERFNYILSFWVCMLGIAFFRNNGKFVMLLTFLCLAIIYRKKIKAAKSFFIVGILSCFLTFFIQGYVYSRLGIISKAEESTAIPLQQLAFAIVRNPSVKDPYGVLAATMPLTKWSEHYTPFIVDSLKWDSSFDLVYFRTHISEFLKTWLINLPGNFKEYVQAFLMETFGFWSVGTQSNYCFCYNFVVPYAEGVQRINIVNRLLGVNLDFLNTLPFFCGSGTLIWIMFFDIFHMLNIPNKKKRILCFIPFIALWGTLLVATPVAFSLRYVFAMALGLPFMVLLPVIQE